MNPPVPIRVFIDADACPVKDETYKVAGRYGLKTFVVSNSWMQVPVSPLIERRVVEAGPDAADDWIAENVLQGDIAVTNDIPLADRVSCGEADRSDVHERRRGLETSAAPPS